MPTLLEEAAEAICGGLHEFEFEFIGETAPGPLESGTTTWWTRGTRPEDVRIAVIRNKPFVLVNIEWRNFAAAPRLVKGSLVIKIDCSNTLQSSKVRESTAEAVHKCLEIYYQVITGTGVAGIGAVPPRGTTQGSSSR